MELKITIKSVPTFFDWFSYAFPCNAYVKNVGLPFFIKFCLQIQFAGGFP